MPKGKRGPIPEMKATVETAEEVVRCEMHEIAYDPEEGCPICLTEAAGGEPTDLTDDSDEIEDVEPSESTPEEPQPAAPAVETAAPLMEYVCPDCIFRSEYEAEAAEHRAGTNHREAVFQEKTVEGEIPKPEQVELFKEPGFVRRHLETRVGEAFLNALRGELEALCRKKRDVEDEKDAATKAFNARIKAHEQSIDDILQQLQVKTQFAYVDCEWRILNDENARGLFRLDTGDCIERRPLTAEDRLEELAKAQADNAPAGEPPAEVKPEEPADEHAAPTQAIAEAVAG
jgi:hypothetical protein